MRRLPLPRIRQILVLGTGRFGALARVEQGERLYLELRLTRVASKQVHLALEASRGSNPLLGEWRLAPDSIEPLLSDKFTLQGARPARVEICPKSGWGDVQSFEDLRFSITESSPTDSQENAAD